jgi:HEPN domain-containing protein
MRNPDLAADHLRRAGVRLRALDVLYDSGSWADVVRESQEIVELTLKGLLRACGVEPPRIHDVADVLVAERDRLPKDLAPHLERLTSVSRALRRDRELAFYGAEDLTPSSFYRENDAVIARDSARDVVALVQPHVAGATVALRVTPSPPDSSARAEDV